MTATHTTDIEHHETPTEKLLRMAHQITTFFESYPEEQGVAAIAEHINKFWDPRMRTALLAHLNAGGEGLDPTIVKTAPLIKPPNLAAA